MEYHVWHGTNQVFDVFDPAMLGLNTDNASSRRAFYFAQIAETAWDYAEFASRNLILDQVAHEMRISAIIANANEASKRGRFDEYERLILEAEDIEAHAVRADPVPILLHCAVRLDNPFEIEASDLTDIGDLMDTARANGHDGLIIHNMHDTPSGAGPACDHFAVFTASAIVIIERFDRLQTYDIPEMVMIS